MKHWNLKRVLSLLLVVCMVTGLLSGVSAMAEDQTANYHEISTDGLKLATEDNAAADETETEEAPYADTDVVRVFVVLEDKPVLQQGYATRGIAGNAAAMAVSKALEAKQAALAAEISANVLSGETLNVHWNLTLAANAMSVDLPYGKMDEVEALKGVKSVMLVPQYSIDPREQADLNTISSGNMIGSYNAWLEGYTGAGSRIAIVDTGLDSDHPSFNSAAFDYSLLVTSTKNGKQIADYNLLTAAKINEVLPQLHAAERYEGLTGNALYVSSKIAFGFNYIDATLDITHDNDQQGDHGTHVAGIATANRYVENADGTYTYADNGVVGVAPDAQVVVMKVFGKNGGAYADDYIAAIEDAIVLDCDSVNLSLGSAAVGFTTPGEAYFANVMDSLDETDTVVCMSAGNSGNWAEDSVNGLLFAEDSNTGRVGSPGAYENSLAVASADNIANTAEYFTVNGANYTYADGAGKTFTGGATCKSAAFTTLDKSEDKSGTEYDFVFIGDPTDPDDTVKYGGEKSDFANTAGKIVLVSRGNGVAFTDKQINADAAKAAAIIVYNNVDGFDAIYAACTKKLPFITIRLDQMKAILASATQDENGVWGGKLTVHGSGVYTDMNATGGVITMSSFSSWGVPGDLSLKPEITAPGGNIYSTRTDGTYGLMSGTSMASPSAAGQAAVVAQYIRENGFAEKAGLTARALAQSLMMGTAVPIMDPDSDVEYSPRRQGSGLGNVENAVNSPAYVTIDGNDDGKVKVEFGDDPARTGTYSFSFHVNNLTDKSVSYRLSASVLAPETVTDEESGTKFIAMNDVAVGANAVFTTDAAGYDLNGDGKLDDGDEEPAVELNGFFAFNSTNNTWARFEPDTAKIPETAAEANVQFASAEYVNGYTVACTTDGYLYVMQHGKFEQTPVCYLNAILIDMAYNKADGKLYAMAALNDENGEPQYGKLVTVDMFTGELTEVGSITSDMMPSSRDGEVPQVLAIRDDGTFYVINASTRNTYLYSFRLTEDGKIGELTNVGKTGFKANYLQSMAFDHSTGELYWAQFVRASSWARPTYKLVKLDLTTGAGTALSDLPGEMTGLYIVRGQGGSTGKTDKPEKVQLTTTSATLYSGNKTALEAFVTPWNLTDRSIVWSSSDEKIATVNANGVVTAVSEGTAVITAASKLDGTVKAECTITVMQNNTTLTGIVHNADGQSFVADIDVDSANYKYLTGALEQDYYSVVQTGDTLLASGDGNLYSLDAENGYAAKELCYTGDLFMSDMAYSPNLDLTLGTYGYYLMLVDPTTENGYRGLWNLQGAFTAIAGIAYAGYDSTYNYFYMLSTSGTIHLIGIAPNGDGYTLSLLHTIVTDKSLAITGQHMHQSLYYDMKTGWIYWARFNGEDSSSIIAINEETEEVVLRGTFDEAAWPVVGLFASKSGAMDLDRTGDFNFSETCTLAQTELSSQDAVALPAGSLPTLEH